jgi:pimeloyl-ACP methyl ester carboxylesterase
MTIDDRLERSAARPYLARTVRGSGPGLLLAHGAGGSTEANYGPILDDLATTHTVVGVDYPGAGTTPRSHHPLSADELADQLVAVADAEGLDRFAISGFSLGGPVAIRAATRHPGRVCALVLTATFAHADAQLRLAASIWRDLYESGDRILLARFLSYVAFSERFLDAIAPPQFDAVISELAGALPSGTPEHTSLVERIDVRDELADISVPTLVIATDADRLVSPELQRRLSVEIPGAQLVAIESGHLPMAEQPAKWHRLIATFLNAHRPESQE